MTKKITLSSPRFRVILGDPENPDSWQELEVQTLTRDIAAAEKLFQQRKWGTPAELAVLLTTVIAFYALRRTAQIDQGTTWDAFNAGCVEVEGLGENPVGPTQPEPETD